MQPLRAALAVMLAVGSTMAGSSCASSRGEGDAAARATRPARRSSTLITREELMATNAPDAYQAVERLHPDWLRGRGLTSFTGTVPRVLVYLDGQRVGEVGTLSRFTLTGIKEIRFHTATDAQQRWGTGHSAGVIEVITQTGTG